VSDGNSEAFASTQTVRTVQGPRLVIKPLGIGDLSSLRAESLNWYRDQKIEVWTRVADKLREAGFSDEEVKDEIRAALRRAEDIEYKDLEDREVIEYEPGQDELPRSQRKIKRKQTVEFAYWWAAECMEGWLFTLWLGATKHESQRTLTIDDVEEQFMDESGTLNQELLEAAADRLGKVTSGNSPASGDEAATTRRERRRRRRRKSTG